MKIVFVTNEHDAQVSVPKRVQMQGKKFDDAEVHIVPFEQVRGVLPITTAPCVFLLFDELEGDFDLANLDSIKVKVKEAKLKKPKKITEQALG